MGFSAETHSGAGHPRWKGGRRVLNGYVYLWVESHPRRGRNGCVGEHVLVAEAALGRELPDGAVVHHVNEDKIDNRPANLVICPDRQYHNGLHARLRVLKAGGDPWAQRICGMCHLVLANEAFPRTGTTFGRGGYSSRCNSCVQSVRVEKIYKQLDVLKHCQICGREFYTHRQSRRKTCGRACFLKLCKFNTSTFRWKRERVA